MLTNVRTKNILELSKKESAFFLEGQTILVHPENGTAPSCYITYMNTYMNSDRQMLLNSEESIYTLA